MANLGCGCFCWALPRSLFALFLCWMAKRISGWGICVSPFAVWVCCFFCVFDLPTYMTTGVHVDVILTCFFSCKDRASERDRPYRRKLDDGWPESVEEQSLLLLVWRHAFYTQALLHTDAFTHRRFYTQTLFTHRRFYTQTSPAQVKSQFYLSF